MANIDSTSARLQMDSCVRVSSACCVTGATLVAMRSAPKRARKHADRTLGRCEAAWNVAATKSAREERSWNAIAPRLARPCRPDGIDCRGADPRTRSSRRQAREVIRRPGDRPGAFHGVRADDYWVVGQAPTGAILPIAHLE